MGESGKLKTTIIHRIIKDLSPKREVSSSKKGHRHIPRSISPEAVSYLTSYINNHLKAIVEACEEALKEINDNPNTYYQQHRYDETVARMAIEKLKGKGKIIL